MTYSAPVDDIIAALKAASRFEARAAAGFYPDLDLETIRAILEEAGAFASGALAPINGAADRAGLKFSNGVVTTPAGFKDAYRQYVEGGWSGLPCSAEFGGQGLPEIVAAPVCEIWNSANMAFGMCPLLTQGAIHAIESGGSDAIKATYLPKMVSGHWTGTMNLTEPHAGSDLSELKTRAVRREDGSYGITGTKIFISFGEHDLAENIIHLVLARLPDAPAGTRGISLFLVPKYLLKPDGSIGERNDVVCAGIEHKLGISASPTCVMKFGEKGRAIGFLVGEENRGLATMFVMMNQARLSVGMQGVAIAERATQRAVSFAKERAQGRSRNSAGPGMSPIIAHPDVKRMLLTMRAMTQAARMICFATAGELDLATKGRDAAERRAAQDMAALLTPVAKAFATDVGVEVASLGIQVHGGMGFVEETGAAQHLRDARILPIYEGTNGIQAIDLVTRKLPLGGGETVAAVLDHARGIADKVSGSDRAEFGGTGLRLREAVAALRASTEWMGNALKDKPDAALAGATPYLRIFGLTAGATYLAECALARDARAVDTVLAAFFAENCLTAAPGLAETVMNGSAAVLCDEGIFV